MKRLLRCALLPWLLVAVAGPARAERTGGEGGSDATPGTLAAPARSADPAAEGAAVRPPGRLLDARFGEARHGRAERLHAWTSVALFAGRVAPSLRVSATTLAEGDAFVIAPSVGMRLALTDAIDATFEWALAYGAGTVAGVYHQGDMDIPFRDARERVEAANPTLLVAWTHAWSVLALTVGLGAAFPVAALAQAPTSVETAVDRAASILVHEAMLAMHGAVDPWRFLPERLAFFVPLRIAVGDTFGGAVELAGGWTIPVLGGQGSSEGVLQVAGDLAFEPARSLRLGLRGSALAWRIGGSAPSDAPPDVQRYQLTRALGALEPWIRLTLGPATATLRATLDLGGDYGLGGPSPIWAIHLGGGGTLPR